jgi:hypothetical protein
MRNDARNGESSMNVGQSDIVPKKNVGQGPETMEAAYATWRSIMDQAEVGGLSDEDGNTLLRQAADIEEKALTLSTVTARDVWLLLAMVSDAPDEEALGFTQGQALARAHREIG